MGAKGRESEYFEVARELFLTNPNRQNDLAWLLAWLMTFCVLQDLLLH